MKEKRFCESFPLAADFTNAGNMPKMKAELCKNVYKGITAPKEQPGREGKAADRNMGQRICLREPAEHRKAVFLAASPLAERLQDKRVGKFQRTG
jgi:hypothetical protein